MISVYLHHPDMVQLKVSKYQKQISRIPLPPKKERKYFFISALEARAKSQKDFCSFCEEVGTSKFSSEIY